MQEKWREKCETHDVDELREFQSEFDSQPIGIISDWPYKTIVVGQ